MGEGRVHDANGVEMETMQALNAAGIKPIELEAKEGLALINGTDGMLGMLIMACADLEQLCIVADITTAMSIEGLLGTDRVFAPDLHAPLRPQIGQAISAEISMPSLKAQELLHHTVKMIHVCKMLTLCVVLLKLQAQSVTRLLTHQRLPRENLHHLLIIQLYYLMVAWNQMETSTEHPLVMF